MPVDKETKKIQQILRILDGESEDSLRRILNYVIERMRPAPVAVPVPKMNPIPDLFEEDLCDTQS